MQAFRSVLRVCSVSAHLAPEKALLRAPETTGNAADCLMTLANVSAEKATGSPHQGHLQTRR